MSLLDEKVLVEDPSFEPVVSGANVEAAESSQMEVSINDILGSNPPDVNVREVVHEVIRKIQLQYETAREAQFRVLREVMRDYPALFPTEAKLSKFCADYGLMHGYQILETMNELRLNDIATNELPEAIDDQNGEYEKRIASRAESLKDSMITRVLPVLDDDGKPTEQTTSLMDEFQRGRYDFAAADQLIELMVTEGEYASVDEARKALLMEVAEKISGPEGVSLAKNLLSTREFHEALKESLQGDHRRLEAMGVKVMEVNQQEMALPGDERKGWRRLLPRRK